MQEPMNMTIHRWSYSWYRSRYCPSSIVQDGGDTTINGTVPIYFRASPNLCHHVGRGINPRGRAVTDPQFHSQAQSMTTTSGEAKGLKKTLQECGFNVYKLKAKCSPMCPF